MPPIAVLAAFILLAGCSGPPPREPPAGDPAAASRLDPRLRRLASSNPDTILGVLVRTRTPAGPDERAALARAGLDVGTTAGDIVTGRLRAGVAPDLARLPFVVYVEAADVLGPTKSPRPPGPEQPAE